MKKLQSLALIVPLAAGTLVGLQGTSQAASGSVTIFRGTAAQTIPVNGIGACVNNTGARITRVVNNSDRPFIVNEFRDCVEQPRNVYVPAHSSADVPYWLTTGSYQVS